MTRRIVGHKTCRPTAIALFILTNKERINYHTLSERRKTVKDQIKGWTREKPTFPCVVLTRTNVGDIFEYIVWRLEMIKGENEKGERSQYLGVLTEDGCEWGDLSELTADEYLIIEKEEGK